MMKEEERKIAPLSGQLMTLLFGILLGALKVFPSASSLQNPCASLMPHLFQKIDKGRLLKIVLNTQLEYLGSFFSEPNCLWQETQDLQRNLIQLDAC